LDRRGDEIVARLAAFRDGAIEAAGPLAVILVRNVGYLLAKSHVQVLAAAEPAMPVPDEAPHRVVLGLLDPDDREPRQEIVAHRQRDDARVEVPERDAPFLGQGPHLVRLVLEQQAKILWLDEKPVAARRRVLRRAQL